MNVWVEWLAVLAMGAAAVMALMSPWGVRRLVAVAVFGLALAVAHPTVRTLLALVALIVVVTVAKELRTDPAAADPESAGAA